MFQRLPSRTIVLSGCVKQITANNFISTVLLMSVYHISYNKSDLKQNIAVTNKRSSVCGRVGQGSQRGTVQYNVTIDAVDSGNSPRRKQNETTLRVNNGQSI